MCVDLDVDAARHAAEAIDGTGATVDAGRVDITDIVSCASAVATVRARFGRLDLLVNAAGVGGLAATGDLPLEDWNHTLQVNLTGVFLMSQRALPALLETRGAIVNIASIAGVRAVPYNAAYCVSKAGVIMLGKAMAAEFGHAGLRVNSVCPASVDTPFLADFAFPDYVDRSLFARAASIIDGPMNPAKSRRRSPTWVPTKPRTSRGRHCCSTAAPPPEPSEDRETRRREASFSCRRRTRSSVGGTPRCPTCRPRARNRSACSHRRARPATFRGGRSR